MMMTPYRPRRRWPQTDEFADDGLPPELRGTDNDVCGFARRSARRRRRVPAETPLSLTVTPADRANRTPMTGDQIREIRRRTGLSQDNLAALLNVHAVYLARRENCPRPLTKGNMLARLHAIRRAELGLLL